MIPDKITQAYVVCRAEHSSFSTKPAHGPLTNAGYDGDDSRQVLDRTRQGAGLTGTNNTSTPKSCRPVQRYPAYTVSSMQMSSTSKPIRVVPSST